MYDAWAFPVPSADGAAAIAGPHRRRLLSGHTASILTGLSVVAPPRHRDDDDDDDDGGGDGCGRRRRRRGGGQLHISPFLWRRQTFLMPTRKSFEKEDAVNIVYPASSAFWNVSWSTSPWAIDASGGVFREIFKRALGVGRLEARCGPDLLAIGSGLPRSINGSVVVATQPH